MESDSAGDGLEGLLRDLCAEIEMGDAQSVIDSRCIEVDGFECSFEAPEGDVGPLYLLFNFGIATAGRTLRLFTAMLEANVTIYAQDEAQLGLDAHSGVVLLLVRAPGVSQVDARWLADTLTHYAEHGRYWRDSIFKATDEAFEGIARGDYVWIQA